MIADKDTNIVYFSDLLRTGSKYAQTCQSITDILDKHQVEYRFLQGAKDIWARDYMPVQISTNKFVEYRYDPDYLQAKKYRQTKSYPDIVCGLNGIQTIKTDLIIDGGNIIKSSDSVIMTDKVINENIENYSRGMIISKLQELFKTDKLALIPWDKECDYFGHADGMVRFIDNKSVLIQSYYDEYDDKFKEKLFGELDRIGLTWKEMKFDVEKEDDRNWAYMNFLQTDSIILLPSFDIDEDIQAKLQIERYYPEYSNGRIKTINMSEIVSDDGALNCISWTIKK